MCKEIVPQTFVSVSFVLLKIRERDFSKFSIELIIFKMIAVYLNNNSVVRVMELGYCIIYYDYLL